MKTTRWTGLLGVLVLAACAADASDTTDAPPFEPVGDMQQLMLTVVEPAADFYWDAVCPWCWITSRWMEDVAEQKSIHVNWKFFSLKKINEAAKLYDTVILPMSCNNDEKFLRSIENKKIITLFANAGCALTCPSKICYPSISKANKVGDPSLFRCSQELKYRELLGMLDFDLNYLQALGFDRFKLLRSRSGDMTGH